MDFPVLAEVWRVPAAGVPVAAAVPLAARVGAAAPDAPAAEAADVLPGVRAGVLALAVRVEAAASGAPEVAAVVFVPEDAPAVVVAHTSAVLGPADEVYQPGAEAGPRKLAADPSCLAAGRTWVVPGPVVDAVD